MAKATVAAQREVSRSETNYATFYTGTRKALIAAKVSKPEWFPRRLAMDTRYNPPRTKRTYAVVGQEQETVLTHRTDASGSEYWIVRIALPPEERAKREAAEREEWEKRQRENAEMQRLSALERAAARPLVQKLRARYPTIRAIDGSCVTSSDGTQKQEIWFDSSLDELKGCGLVTAEMMSKDKGHNWYSGDLSNGDRFCLYVQSDLWRFTLHTYSVPQERKRLDLREAKLLLKRIAVSS